ncbi:MAG TPA: hypothetical protein VI160_03700, partial [Gemmatimonadales bacterium]
ASPAWRALAPIDRPYVALATTFARAGRTADARRLLREAQAIVPDSTARAWRSAAVALDLLDGKFASAAGRLTAGLTNPWPECPSCDMYPIADAWDRAGQADSALAWYLHALTTPGSRQISADAPWRARALQRVAELERAAGRPDLAAGAERQWRALWATADSDVVSPPAPGPARLASLRRAR